MKSENKIDFNVSVGKDELNNDLIINIPELSHLLIGGISGSGKSNLLHHLIATLSHGISPNNVKLVLIDPKKIELNIYNHLPHLLTPVITDPKKAIIALKWSGKEADRRLGVLQSENVRDIQSYHEKLGGKGESLPTVLIFIDDLPCLLEAYPDEIEAAITRLSQMSHKVGIHLILSTSRVASKVITEPIKSNIPARIAFKLSSANDSMGIVGIEGAEKLETQSEILFQSGRMKYPVCARTSFISEDEIKEKVEYIVGEYKEETISEINLDTRSASSQAFDALLDDGEEDDLYDLAREEAIASGKVSTSYLQRKLGVGYSHAAKLMDILEARGVIGPAKGSAPREVINQGTVH